VLALLDIGWRDVLLYLRCSGFDGNAATLTYDVEREGYLLLRLLNKEAPDASAKILSLSLSALRVRDLKELLKAKEDELARVANGVAWAVDLSKPLGLRMNSDAEVASCVPDGQADKSGLPLAGKTIVEIDGKEVIQRMFLCTVTKKNL